MTDRPRVLIEDWLPVAELGIESRRERAAASALPPLSFLHVWWARRPLVACAGVVLASVLPTWSEALASRFEKQEELRSEASYRQWFLRLCGILGDPIRARREIDAANDRGEKLEGNGYGYRQAFRNSPSKGDLALLLAILQASWGQVPEVLDPTAGGGSIPYEAVRYGLPATANDLNPVAAAILRAGVEIPAKLGTAIVPDLKTWGEALCARLHERLDRFFRLEDPHERVVAYIFTRTVACPRTGKLVPLSPNWWLSKGADGTAVRLVTERKGRELDAVEFEILAPVPATYDPDRGTVAGGDAVSPWDHLAIDGDHIKAEAQAGRMGSQLYAVAVRVGAKRKFRAPTPTDVNALCAADEELREKLPAWTAAGVVPTEDFPPPIPKHDIRPYGFLRWVDFFSARQLLVHGTFAEEFQRLITEVEAESTSARPAAALGLLGMMQGKSLNWNAVLSSWNVGGESMRSVFERHDFSFKWTYAEFDGARELYPWCLSQLLDAYEGIAALLKPASGGGLDSLPEVAAPAAAKVMKGNAGDLRDVADRSQTLVCIDPPYYDNVMYGELSDFFLAWEQHTIGKVWPDLMEGGLSDKENEAVANIARFASSGRRRKDLANADYEAKMTAIFQECRRVLRDEGVLTVMFTHKRAEAWDTLGMGLMEAGFVIETSWPVNTEREQSLHQAKLNAAASTIVLVCRKRPPREGGPPFFEDLESQVREAARDALLRFSSAGISGVDLLLSTYGPALAVISSQWPVFSSEADKVTGRSRLLRPEEALDAARAEVVRIQRQRLLGRPTQLDPLTDFALIAWDTFKAAEFPYDEARRLALATGGLEVDMLARAKVLEKKSGTVVLLEPARRVRRGSAAEESLPGVRPEATSFAVAIDAVHTVLYVADVDGMAAAKSLIERAGLAKDARFLAALQGLARAVPRTRIKGDWVRSEARLLDAVCTAWFPDVSLPGELAEGPEQYKLFHRPA
jgi:putative DNA methylase